MSNVFELISLISAIFGILSFFLLDRKLKYKALLFFILLSLSFYAGFISNEKTLSVEEELPTDDQVKKDVAEVFEIRNLIWSKFDSDCKPRDATVYCYDYDENNCTKYPLFYDASSAESICSCKGIGWRLPTTDEWHALVIESGAKWDNNIMRWKYGRGIKSLAKNKQSWNINFAGELMWAATGNGERPFFRGNGERAVYWATYGKELGHVLINKDYSSFAGGAGTGQTVGALVRCVRDK